MERKISVQYNGKDGRVTVSPVFDVLHVPVPVPGRFEGQVQLMINSFFLVFESMSEKKLFLIPIQNCQVIENE